MSETREPDRREDGFAVMQFTAFELEVLEAALRGYAETSPIMQDRVVAAELLDRVMAA